MNEETNRAHTSFLKIGSIYNVDHEKCSLFGLKGIIYSQEDFTVRDRKIFEPNKENPNLLFLGTFKREPLFTRHVQLHYLAFLYNENKIYVELMDEVFFKELIAD